jgi:3-hydroxy-9,10-secoandrosta-1,3,5(10)-triene-9,17-dione monooxygenase
MNAPHRKMSFDDVSYAEAVRRAEALVPLLREEAAQSERLTRLTPRAIGALHESGLPRYMQPKRWGGMERDVVSMVECRRSSRAGMHPHPGPS